MNIEEVLLWIAGILTSIGIILKFIDVQFVQKAEKRYKEEKEASKREHLATVEQLKATSQTNKTLMKLADQMEHNNAIQELKMSELKKDVDLVDWKVDKTFEVLDVRLVKVEDLMLNK